MNNQLLVFLKRPAPGRVKTRLAKAIGDEEALEVYNWLVDTTKNAFMQTEAKIQLYFDDSNGILPDWVNSYTTYFQKGNDLGERMAMAFKDRFNIDPNAKLVLIGSDCPEISAEVLNEAFESLKSNNIVLGPAKDGGVYLIGLDQWNDDFFEGIEWSTDSVCESLINNSEKLNLSCAFLKELRDIDLVEDFLHYKKAFDHYKKELHVSS